MTPEIKLVPKQSLKNMLYARKVDFTDTKETQHYKKECDEVLKSVIDSLGKHWKFNIDFQVQDDFGHYMEISAGLYMPSIYCRKYIDVAMQMIQEQPLFQRWIYTSILEPYGEDFRQAYATQLDENFFTSCGDIIFYMEGIFANEDELKRPA